MKKPNQIKDQQVRISQTIPIIIKGKNVEDKAYLEKTTAEDVTRRGVFFSTQQHLIPGSSVRLYSVNDPTKTIAKVEVVWVRNEPSSGVGTKLIGSNRSWMKFLLENSISVVEEETKTQTKDEI
ncbi:MAG: hypothetical protein HY819_13470 [Acidobacteria bacterium]|nr:hypothetical protein [Acidobacteriota bacterium]